MKVATSAIVFCMTFAVSNGAWACNGSSPRVTVMPMPAVTHNGEAQSANINMTVTTDAYYRSCVLGVRVKGGPMILRNAQTNSTIPFQVQSPFWDSGNGYVMQYQLYPSQTLNLSIPIRFSGSQSNLPSGTYAAAIDVSAFNVVYGGDYVQTTQWITAHVPTTCVLNTPSPAALDFSQAIINGLVPAPFQRSVVFPNSGCNGPARLSLRGEPMQLNQPAPSSINFMATAFLGNSQITFDSRNGVEAAMNAIAAPESGNIPLSITIPPIHTPLAPGTYTSFLRTTLEPAQ